MDPLTRGHGGPFVGQWAEAFFFNPPRLHLGRLSARYQRNNSTRLYCIGTDRKEIPIFPCTHIVYIFERGIPFQIPTYVYLNIILCSFVLSSLSPPSHHSRTCLNIYPGSIYILVYSSWVYTEVGIYLVYIYALISCVRNIGISNSYPWNSRSHVSATERCNIIYI